MQPSRRTYILELTKKCNNNCLYCYNVWKADKDYPKNELNTEEWKKIIDIIVEEEKPRLFGISGGEPLMRNDIIEILQYVQKYKITVTLITNGTLLNPILIRRLIKYGVKLFELPLLGATAEVHDSLTRNPGSWKKVLKNISEIKRLGGRVTSVFVITKKNIAQIKDIMEMAIALGANSILANRFNVGGEGIKFKRDLLPSPDELRMAYEIMNDLAGEYEIAVMSGVPVPACVIDTSQYKNISFPSCSLGKENQYYAVDPAGNLRPCNHSAFILGNLLLQPVSEILDKKELINYVSICLEGCQGCDKLSSGCKGGCRAASEVYYHDFKKQDPFVAENFKGIVKIDCQ